jgi:hypothetical protein
MDIFTPQRMAVIVLVAWLAGGSLGTGLRAADPKDDAKPEIVLPKDAKAVVISYDPGAGGFVRKGPPPYLQIQADGQVTVVNLLDGARKEATLTAKELDDLLRFIIHDKDFLNVTETKINDGIKEAAGKGPFIAVGGAGTAVITIQANGKKHTVSYRGASAYLSAYPKVEPLAQFVAVEKRLQELGQKVSKGK